MQDYLALFGGVACAALGGELFVRSAVGLARALRVSTAIVGATIVAFATSSPELSVAITAAINARPEIALGDAVGSNVVNIALILGLALVISPIQSPRTSVKRDFTVALAVPAVTVVLVMDGTLSRVEGVFLVTLFILWLAAVTVQAHRQRGDCVNDGPRHGWRYAALGVAGLLLLLAAGWMIVRGASGIALSFGLSPFVVGATIVAVGTSVPELATAVVAKLRGHDEVGLGTLLGSNIFNGLWIVPVAAIIHPIVLDWREVALALGFGVAAMTVALPPEHGLIGRSRGTILLLIYGCYVVAIFIQ
jgi:cation:H+ antiporter